MDPHLVITLYDRHLTFTFSQDCVETHSGSDPTPNGGVRAERIEYLTNHFRNFHPKATVEILLHS